MKKKEEYIITGNILLADFIAEQKNLKNDEFWKLHSFGIETDTRFILKKRPDLLKFHLFYGWIYYVVDIINSLDKGIYSILICKDLVKIEISDKISYVSCGENSIFDVCVYFVKWYNKTKEKEKK